MRLHRTAKVVSPAVTSPDQLGWSAAWDGIPVGPAANVVIRACRAGDVVTDGNAVLA